LFFYAQYSIPMKSNNQTVTVPQNEGTGINTVMAPENKLRAGYNLGDDLLGTNYDDSENVFSVTDDQRILPNLHGCLNCGTRCTGSQCTSCGHSIKNNNYPKMTYAGKVGATDLIKSVELAKPSNDSSKHVGLKNAENNNIEHMNASSNTENWDPLIAYIFFICFLFLIASHKGHLTGTIQGVSTGLCILIFPFAYLSYLIVDLIVPKYNVR
jgi:hypothetical protein